jgi:hypothetical protein
MSIINRLVPWIVGVFVLTVAMAAIYLTMQQVERLGADDAGARLASAVASAGSESDDPVASRVDAERSDSAFYVVYDRSGRPVRGNGFLGDELAAVPVGVVTTAFEHGSNHVTWQTPDGRRFATVELRSGDEVVMAAQSLAPTEHRIDLIGVLLLGGWAVSILVLAGGAALHVWWLRSPE